MITPQFIYRQRSHSVAVRVSPCCRSMLSKASVRQVRRVYAEHRYGFVWRLSCQFLSSGTCCLTVVALLILTARFACINLLWLAMLLHAASVNLQARPGIAPETRVPRKHPSPRILHNHTPVSFRLLRLSGGELRALRRDVTGVVDTAFSYPRSRYATVLCSTMHGLPVLTSFNSLLPTPHAVRTSSCGYAGHHKPGSSAVHTAALCQQASRWATAFPTLLFRVQNQAVDVV